jgi:small subunit ribosomal protein S19
MLTRSFFKRIEDMNSANEKKVIKTWSRDCTIFPQMVSHTIAVHDGRKHVPVFVTEDMVAISSANLRRRGHSEAMPEKKRP